MKHMSHEDVRAKNKLESTEKDLIIKEISSNDCLQIVDFLDLLFYQLFYASVINHVYKFMIRFLITFLLPQRSLVLFAQMMFIV